MDDFIFTISDNESLPDHETDESITKLPRESNKRKRGDDNHVNTDTTNKKNKKNKTKENVDRGDSENEMLVVDKDDEVDSEFEFNGFGLGDAVVEGFGDWAQASNGQIATGDRAAVNVDDIIARRRKSKETALADDLAEDDKNAANATPNEDEELLEEDVFGMGADMDEDDNDIADGEDGEDEDDDEVGENEVEDVATENEHSYGAVNGEDSDADSIAAPVAHPDDDIDPSEDIFDAEEVAKQAAFFAPEDVVGNAAAPLASFSAMSLSRPILKGLTAVGFSTPTPIQAKAIPYALQGKDVVGGAVTGSGKTGAFMIPIVERLLYRPKKVPTTRVGPSCTSLSSISVINS